MLRGATLVVALSMGASSVWADGPAGNTGYALADIGGTLVVMADLAAPDEIQTFDLATSLRAIAWRPVTGDLVGFADGTIFTVDPASGALTDLGATFMDDAVIGEGAVVALDFNNKIDAVRAVSSSGDNLVYFPGGFGYNDDRANSVRRFTSLFYADGDANAGSEPRIFANAYTNAINGETASGTFQYAIDAFTNAFVSLANNAGTLETVGLITINGEPADMIPMGGFDIVSPAEGDDHAYAILQIDGQETAGLYAIDLTSGEATMMADLGMGGFTGFAASMPAE